MINIICERSDWKSEATCMGSPLKAYHKQDSINISRAIKQYHLLKACSSLALLIGVSLCGCVHKRVGEQECTGYNLCYLQEKTEALNEEEHMFLGRHLCKKYTAPEVVLRKKKLFKSLLFHTRHLLGTFFSYCPFCPTFLTLRSRKTTKS